MKQVRGLLQGRYRDLITNVSARIGALVALAVATFVVARSGGPAVVGIYVLLRVLPSLVGVVISAGLPGAVTYFLAGEHRGDRRLPLTVLSIAFAGGLAGALVWVAAAPMLDEVFFPGLSLDLVLLSAILVFTRVFVATAKSCSQGSDDLPGANRVILTEELMFLPAYGILLSAGASGFPAVVAGLILADLATLSLGWARLARRGFFRGATRPSRSLARVITSYGIRAQVGGVISLMNLRLDFILLNLMAGPAVLGIYAIASKFAELVRIPATSLTYVLYPRFAKAGRVEAAAKARSLLPKAALLTTATIAPLWLVSSFLIPAVYGTDFEAAVVPAQIILLGFALSGVGAVVTAFLYGVGHPGLNSLAMGAGLVVTVALDLLLIPRFEANGAAVASAVAYTVSSLVLLACFARESRANPTLRLDASASPGAEAR